MLFHIKVHQQDKSKGQDSSFDHFESTHNNDLTSMYSYCDQAGASEIAFGEERMGILPFYPENDAHPLLARSEHVTGW